MALERVSDELDELITHTHREVSTVPLRRSFLLL